MLELHVERGVCGEQYVVYLVASEDLVSIEAYRRGGVESLLIRPAAFGLQSPSDPEYPGGGRVSRDAAALQAWSQYLAGIGYGALHPAEHRIATGAFGLRALV